MKFTKTSFLLVAILCFNLPRLHSQSNTIQFDGSDDYVQLANRFNIGTSNFTFEVWVKPATTTAMMVFAQDVNGDANEQFRLETITTQAKFTLSGTGGTPYVQVLTASGTVPTSEWTHIAVVRNGLTITVYINGVSSNSGSSATVIDNKSGADATKPFRIGARGPVSVTAGQNNFNGNIDELRYWNIVRTPAEIKSRLFKSPAVNAGGLVAMYKFDAGTGTVLSNSSTNTTGIDGTLTNGPTWAASPIKYSANALNFDGSNDYVSIGAAIPSNSSFTKEAWVYATTVGGAQNILSSENTPFWLNGGYLNAGIAGSYSNVTDAAYFPANTWVHVAVTFDDPTNTMKLYKNGVLVSTNSSVTANYSSENIFIGSHQSMSSFWLGSIDELRIWNTARTQTEIQNNMNKELIPSGEANLLSYYDFNGGAITGTNSGLRLVQDTKGNYNGSTVNFAMTGAGSNFVTQYASIILPVKWNAFTASLQSEKVLLQWSTTSEQNTRSFTVQRSSNLNIWKNIGTLSAAGNSSTLVYYNYKDENAATGNNYYRIQQTDLDGLSTYSEVRNVSLESKTKEFTIKTTLVSNNSLTIQVNKQASLSLYNMQGNLLWKRQLETGLQEIPVYNYAKGMYILKGNEETGKIIIQ